MTITSDPRLQQLHDRLDEALEADIPSLPEIRQRREKIIMYLARCVWEVLYAHGEMAPAGSRLRVITNDSPAPGSPRGICSPVKTDEFRQFEALAREVFRNAGTCTTVWLEQV
jgi:hypothetical protein